MTYNYSILFWLQNSYSRMHFIIFMFYSLIVLISVFFCYGLPPQCNFSVLYILVQRKNTKKNSLEFVLYFFFQCYIILKCSYIFFAFKIKKKTVFSVFSSLWMVYVIFWVVNFHIYLFTKNNKYVCVRFFHTFFII